MNDKWLQRFSWIDNFIAVRKRMPKNWEIGDAFNLKVGGATKDVLDRYEKSLQFCPYCGKKINK